MKRREADLKCRSEGRSELAAFVARVRNIAAISVRYDYSILVVSILTFQSLKESQAVLQSAFVVLFLSSLGSLFTSGSRKCHFKFLCQ